MGEDCNTAVLTQGRGATVGCVGVCVVCLKSSLITRGEDQREREREIDSQPRMDVVATAGQWMKQASGRTNLHSLHLRNPSTGC
jgi:hypothetical protein